MKLLNKAVDVFLFFWQKIPPIVFHNVAKASMLKMVFWHLAVDGHRGAYLEFGVAQGNSLRAAVLANENAVAKIIGVEAVERTFYGFDTFETFVSDDTRDIHPTWKGGKFNNSFENVKKRFIKYPFVNLIKSNVLEVHEMGNSGEMLDEDGAAVILFDMDLFAPTIAALNWSKAVMRQGTFLIFDEPFAFSGDPKKGEGAAISKFKIENPGLVLREFSKYGAGGVVYIVERIS
jgi:hypothetical protein